MNVKFLEKDNEVLETYWFSVDGLEYGVVNNNNELSLVDYGGFNVDNNFDCNVYSDIKKVLFAEVKKLRY